VKEDLDNDDDGDVNLAGVNVTLVSSTGSIVGSMLTDSSGNYKFIDLAPGQYTVVQMNLPGYSDVSDTEGSPTDNKIKVDLSVGEKSVGNDFVDERLGSIAGSVFDDIDRDGDGDEPLVGVNVTLFLDGKAIMSMLTGLAGKYKFDNLPAGAYTVKQTNLPGYLDVSDTQGDPTDNLIDVVLTPGEKSINNDFVDVKPTSAPTRSPTTRAPTTLMPSVRPCVFDSNAAHFTIVIDGSESIRDASFLRVRQAMKELAFGISQASPQSRFSLVSFSKDAVVLGRDLDANSTFPILSSMIHLKGGTNTPDAINVAQSLYNLTDDKPHIMILITDGVPTIEATLEDEAFALTDAAATAAKNAGTQIVGVQINEALSLFDSELLFDAMQKWVSEPQLLFVLASWEALLTKLKPIIADIECN